MQPSCLVVKAVKISTNPIFRISGHCNIYLEITITKLVKLLINITQYCNSVFGRITVASVWVQSDTKIQDVYRLLLEMPIWLRTSQPTVYFRFKNMEL
jgi:hypothetical protein